VTQGRDILISRFPDKAAFYESDPPYPVSIRILHCLPVGKGWKATN